MKKIILAATVMIVTYATSFAQSKTPASVVTTFNKIYPDATKVKWDKENDHNYEASFELKGVNYSANFNENGEWLELEIPYSFDQLPEKVQNAFNASHKGVVPKAVSKIETAREVIIYEIEFQQGAKVTELFYTEDGAETKEY